MRCETEDVLRADKGAGLRKTGRSLVLAHGPDVWGPPALRWSAAWGLEASGAQAPGRQQGGPAFSLPKPGSAASGQCPPTISFWFVDPQT